MTATQTAATAVDIYRTVSSTLGLTFAEGRVVLDRCAATCTECGASVRVTSRRPDVLRRGIDALRAAAPLADVVVTETSAWVNLEA